MSSQQQSRLKKNSAIDRSSSQATGVTSGSSKLGQSKTASKIHHANDSSMHSGSSKHHHAAIQQQHQQRELSQKYASGAPDKSQSTSQQVLQQMSKHGN